MHFGEEFDVGDGFGGVSGGGCGWGGGDGWEFVVGAEGAGEGLADVGRAEAGGEVEVVGQDEVIVGRG